MLATYVRGQYHRFSASSLVLGYRRPDYWLQAYACQERLTGVQDGSHIARMKLLSIYDRTSLTELDPYFLSYSELCFDQQQIIVQSGRDKTPALHRLPSSLRMLQGQPFSRQSIAVIYSKIKSDKNSIKLLSYCYKFWNQ